MITYDDLINPIYDRLNVIYYRLHEQLNGLDRYRYNGKGFYSLNPNATPIPDKIGGIYIMFETSEKYNDFDRVVRVGKAEDSLYYRLKQHFIDFNKDLSIFRKHIGKAQLSGNQDLLEEWKTRKTKNRLQEEKVTEYLIDNISFCIIPLSNKEQIRKLEQTLIEILSIHNRLHQTIDTQNPIPTEDWLGKKCDNEKVMESGMWNVEHIRNWKK